MTAGDLAGCCIVGGHRPPLQCVFVWLKPTTTLSGLHDAIPAVSEESILNLVDNEDFLVPQIQCRTSRGDQPCGVTFDGGLGRDVTVVRVIPNSNERFSEVARD